MLRTFVGKDGRPDAKPRESLDRSSDPDCRLLCDVERVSLVSMMRFRFGQTMSVVGHGWRIEVLNDNDTQGK